MPKILFLLLFLLIPVQTFGSPLVSTREEFISLVKSCIEKGIAEFLVDSKTGLNISNEDILYACNVPHVTSRVVYEDEIRTRTQYRLAFYPGLRIARSYLANNISNLTADERRVLAIATSIVDRARGLDDMSAELFFHDAICETAVYKRDEEPFEIPRSSTAIGVFLDYEANCQGYSDAFQMLCLMFGIRADMQSGYTGESRHVWNVVLINGRWYAVDVTWDDTDSHISHIYFNAPTNILLATHDWELKDQTVAIVRTPDENYFYRRDERENFGLRFPDENGALEYAANALGRKNIQLMFPKGEFGTIEKINKEIERRLSRKGRRMSFRSILRKHADYFFLNIKPI